MCTACRGMYVCSAKTQVSEEEAGRRCRGKTTQLCNTKKDVMQHERGLFRNTDLRHASTEGEAKSNTTVLLSFLLLQLLRIISRPRTQAAFRRRELPDWDRAVDCEDLLLPWFVKWFVDQHQRVSCPMRVCVCVPHVLLCAKCAMLCLSSRPKARGLRQEEAKCLSHQRAASKASHQRAA